MSHAGPMAVLKSPQAARVLTASLVGRLPLGAAPLALLVLARETGSLAAAGLLVGAFGLGVALMPVAPAVRWTTDPARTADSSPSARPTPA